MPLQAQLTQAANNHTFSSKFLLGLGPAFKILCGSVAVLILIMSRVCCPAEALLDVPLDTMLAL